MNYQELLQANEKQFNQFEKYASLLAQWNEKFNLTAITDYDGIFNRHFLDSLDLAKYCFQNNIVLNGTLVDVGSGAGFPGLPLKIMYPELKVILIEPTGKRCTFLAEIVKELGLKDVLIVNERSEDYALKHYEEFDFVTARAVSDMSILTEICLPLVKVNGHFIALKGPKAYEELEHTKAISLLGGKINKLVEYSKDDGNRVIVDVLKIKETDRKYPRNYAQIKKKPL